MINIAIGDIHGCIDELRELLFNLSEYHNRDNVRWIFLGDYVDRGPNVSAVVELLLNFNKYNQCIFIKGNHEDMMLEAFHNGRDDFTFWSRNGGNDTLKSYSNEKGSWKIPDNHMEFYRTLITFYETEKYFFCHAGVHPAYDLHNQLDSDLMWIRQTFLYSDVDFGKIIVHGHSPMKDRSIEQKTNRINIDTGCVFDGYLTAAIIEDEQWPEFVQVKSKISWTRA